MDNNLQMIGRAVDYIEEHLTEENLSLDRITGEIGYSKYHLHRMFTFVVGIPIHRYILRRRLTEAARMLVFTAKTPDRYRTVLWLRHPAFFFKEL
ncbi:AraC family bacterial regulatory protein [Anaerostipes caccae]|uniref:AraC family transcriptional regulator n=1 Tax=Anaerostipes caccae TaxID=105841 RepID=UPI0001F00B1B|nr:AraC family transcriptional regulator [Anaerostipes caccae]EFV24113.1 AraC family bacterial regulatory protein [Anaerostipes caccae]